MKSRGEEEEEGDEIESIENLVRITDGDRLDAHKLPACASVVLDLKGSCEHLRLFARERVDLVLLHARAHEA